MNDGRNRLAWAPPLLVGASAAVASEVAAALLLYSGPGLPRSLTVILVVVGGAFGMGLWTAPPAGAGVVDGLRRRWLFCLFVYLVAVVLGAMWSLFELPDPWGQVIGLAFLAGLPVFASGSVLGGISAVRSAPGGGSTVAVGSAAAIGAALGFALTGILLPRAPLPASLLITCLVMLSLGGMLFGASLGARVETEVIDSLPSGAGGVRVEEHHGPSRRVAKVLLEGASERSRTSPDEVLWEVATATALMPPNGDSWSVLHIGGGASPLTRWALEANSGATVHVIERDAATIELGREHFDTGLSVGDADRVRVSVGNLEDLVKGVRERYDTVLVDARAFSANGGDRSLSREARGRLVQAVADTGVLVWGPNAPDIELELTLGWRVASYTRGSEARPEEVLVFSQPRADPDPLDSYEDFQARPEPTGADGSRA